MEIDLYNYVPEQYYNHSRDFQLLGRLYGLLFNYAKMCSDFVKDMPSGATAENGMLDALALTLGFKAKHVYGAEQLKAICGILPLLLRNKGSLNAIVLACRALLNSEGIYEKLDTFMTGDGTADSPYTLNILLPLALSDTTLLQDLLDYLLPAGMACQITQANQKQETTTQGFAYSDRLYVYRLEPDRASSVFKAAATKEESQNINSVWSPEKGTYYGDITSSVVYQPTKKKTE